MAKKYPLEPLQRLRADEVDAGARALAEAARGRAAKEGERARREAAHAALVARTSAEAAREQNALENGALRAGDLALGASWKVAVEEQKAQSAQIVANAKEAEEGARAEEARKLFALAEKKAEAEAVLRHRERWEGERARAAQGLEDEAAEEAHGARLHRNRKGSPC